MIRGTTPIHTFELPFDTSLLADVYITYAQEGKQVTWFDLSECERDGNKLIIRLTQEETFLFNCSKGFVYIQIRARTVDGDVLASEEMRVEVKRCLGDEVEI